MQENPKAITPVKFESVSVGTWFKERENGAWHLKTSETSGMYQSWGTRYDMKFSKTETVLV